VAQYALSFLLTSLVMSAIILVILVFNALFPKAFPAKLRYAVWLVVLLGLIIPLRPFIGDGFVTISLPATVQSQPDEIKQITEPLPEMDFPQDSAEIGGTGRTISPVIICIIVWGAVSAMIFAYHIWRYIRFIRMIRRWGVSVKDEKILSVLRTVRTEKGLDHKKIGLKVCGFVSSSMLTGFLHPVILLPEKHFEEDELELIFRHELIHYKRRDLLVKLMSVIAVSLNWFNPIVYWMCAATQTDGEVSCDEAVLQDTGIENRQFYAEVIIGMIGGKNTSGTLLSTCFYGGKSSIKRRLDSIMDTTRKMKKPAVGALVAVTALTVLSGSVFALAVQEPPAVITPPVTPETAAIAGITVDKAKDIALATVGGGTVTQCKLENEREVYKATVLYGDKRYSMDIDAVHGAVTNYRLEAIETVTPSSSSETQAPSDTPAPLTTDTPPPATTIPPSSSLQSTPSPSTPSSNSDITTEWAKEIALAKVGGGTVTECKLDYENGRKVYEIKIVYGNTKYEMDVDAITGVISDYSAETINGSSGSKTDHDDDHDSDDDHDD